MATQTGVARISLAAGGTPTSRTNHKIIVYARVTSGAGTLRAALYEGSNNRSGDLESSALTSAFARYELSISEANAANITSYADLELRLWGYAAGGGAIVFEIARAYLAIPEAAPFAATSLSIVATFSTSASVNSADFVTGVGRLSLEPSGTPTSRASHVIVVRARLEVGSGFIRAALYEGSTNRSGDLDTGFLTGNFAEYLLPIAEADAEDITDYSNLEVRLQGRGTANAVFAISEVSLRLPLAGSHRLGIATEVSTAFPTSTNVSPIYPSLTLYPSESLLSGHVLVDIAEEFSTAHALTASGTAATVLVGLAEEWSYALTREGAIILVPGIAVESNLALAIGSEGGAQVIQVGLAVEENLGRLVGGTGALVPNSVIRDGTEDLVIGASYDVDTRAYSQHLGMVMDELALLGTAISSEEVRDLYLRVKHVGSDGREYDGTTGVWEATTNILANGGFEGSAAGWSAVSGATFARSTSYSHFGRASLRVQATGTGKGVTSDSGSVTAGALCTASVWARGEGIVRIELEERTAADALVGTGQGPEVTLTAGWQRLSVTRDFGGTGAKARLRVVTMTAAAADFYLDGGQVEEKGFPSPYVDTNGLSEQRTAARIQASAAYLDEQEGWLAARVRPGWGNSAEPTSDPTVFSWVDGSKLLSLVYDTATDAFVFTRNDGMGSTTTSVAKSITADERITVIAAWTASAVKVSVNGATFVSNAGGNVPAITTTLFDIGSVGGSSGHLNGDFLWLACGVGTLTDSDASRMFDLNDEPPRQHSYPAASELRFSWDAVDDFGMEAGYTHDLARGPIRRIFHDVAARRSSTELTIIDGMEDLAAESGILYAESSEQMGEGIARVLNAAGVLDPSRYELDPGESGIGGVANDGTKTWLQVITELVLSDFGLFFVDGSGRYIFRERRSRPLAEYQGRISREMRALQPGVDLDRIVNEWTVTARGELAQGEEGESATASFERSRRRYRLRRGEIAAEHLETHDQAYSLAEYLVRRTSEPDSPVYGVELDNRSDRLLAFCLGLEVGDMISLLARGTIGYYVVEQVAVEANVEEGSHRVGLVVSRL